MNENVSICPDGGAMVGCDRAPPAVIFRIVLFFSFLTKKGGGGRESAQQITFIRCIVTELKSETNVPARERKRKRATGRAQAVAVRRQRRRRRR